MLVIYCIKISVIVCLYFPADSHTLLTGNHVLQQDNFYRVVIFQATDHTLLCAILKCSKLIFDRAIIFSCCKPYVVLY